MLLFKKKEFQVSISLRPQNSGTWSVCVVKHPLKAGSFNLKSKCQANSFLLLNDGAELEQQVELSGFVASSSRRGSSIPGETWNRKRDVKWEGG